MTDTDRLAALLDDALRPYLELLRSPDDQNGKIIRGVAARLAAAGVTVAPALDEPSCCELACYEDEGCQCEGCVGPAPDPEACTVCGKVDCTSRHAQPAPDAPRYRREAAHEGGGMVPDPDGQWVHVSDFGITEWSLDALDAQPAPDAPRGPYSMEVVRDWMGLDLWMALGHDSRKWTGWTADVWADMCAEVRAQPAPDALRAAAQAVVEAWDPYQPADTAEYIDDLRAALATFYPAQPKPDGEEDIGGSIYCPRCGHGWSRLAVVRNARRAPSGTRLVVVSEDVPHLFAARSEAGNRITFEWGEPDECGWYTPTLTEHHDQPLPAPDALRAAAQAVVEAWDARDYTNRSEHWMTVADTMPALRAALGDER